MTIGVVPRSQETFPLRVSSLQGLVNSYHEGVPKFSTASPQTQPVRPRYLRHTNSFQCPQYCFADLIHSPLRDSSQRQIVWIANKHNRDCALRTLGNKNTWKQLMWGQVTRNPSCWSCLWAKVLRRRAKIMQSLSSWFYCHRYVLLCVQVTCLSLAHGHTHY